MSLDDDLDFLFDAYDRYIEENISEDIREVHKKRSKFFAVDIHRLSEERAAQGAMFAYIAHSHQTLLTLKERINTQLEIEASKILLGIRETDNRSVQKGGFSKDEKEAMIKTTPAYVEKLVELKLIEDKIGHVAADKEASIQKSYMLTSLGSDKKAEEGMKTWQKKKEKT